MDFNLLISLWCSFLHFHIFSPSAKIHLLVLLPGSLPSYWCVNFKAMKKNYYSRQVLPRWSTTYFLDIDLSSWSFELFVTGRNSIYLSYDTLSNIYYISFSHKPVYSLFSIPLQIHYTFHIKLPLMIVYF